MKQGAQLQDPFELVGSVLEGQYRVDGIVGEGGFGVVYRGRHLSLDQPIAIKVLKGLDGGDPRINALVLEKFRAEARLLYTLSQSSLHIVRALDFGATTMPSGVWAPFMILEWLEGRSLADDLDERRRRGLRGRSLAEALAILEPVADGLSVAHEQRVAHRDIKPANIFLLPPGASRGANVKVLDFGIAKIMKEGESAGTKGTFASFTWLYATPEQLDPRLGTTGLATDVYAFALVLTELLTDREPMEAHDVIGIMKAATDRQRRPTPRSRGANIPDEVEAVCHRALAVDPNARYASIGELWAALQATRSSGRPSTTMQPVPSSPRLPAPGPAAPLFVATPQSVATSQAHAHRTSPPIGTPPPMPSPWAMGTPPRPVTAPPGFSPPPGTAPPAPQRLSASYPAYPAMPPQHPVPPGAFHRRLPFVRADNTSPIAVLTIVLFVFALLFAGSCALISSAC